MTTDWPEPPVAGDELSTLLGSLERQRATFAWKCAGLDAKGLRTSTAASTLTLGGLLKHLAFIEAYYFQLRLLDRSPGAPWETVDWDAHPDWPWSSAADDPPEELYALWSGAVVRSRAAVDEFLASGDLGTPARRAADDGNVPSLRRILADLVEEYARHTGHADIIRESIDGLTGEDPEDWKAPTLWPREGLRGQ